MRKWSKIFLSDDIENGTIYMWNSKMIYTKWIIPSRWRKYSGIYDRKQQFNLLKKSILELLRSQGSWRSELLRLRSAKSLVGRIKKRNIAKLDDFVEKQRAEAREILDANRRTAKAEKQTGKQLLEKSSQPQITAPIEKRIPRPEEIDFDKYVKDR